MGAALKSPPQIKVNQALLRRTRKGIPCWLAALLILGCRLGAAGQPAPVQTLPFTPLPASTAGDWYSVYFTDPGGPSSESLRAGPDQSLAEAIGRARLSVDLAVLRLDLWSVRDALIDAHRGGVSVRLVTDSDYMEEREIQEIIAAGIPVVEDRGAALMHNKFAVIDRLEVWSGSMNMTVGDAYRNNNNLVRLRSGLLAENYTREFEEMFIEHHFGPDSPSDTPHPELSIEGTHLENYFSPDDQVAARLVELIRSARESIFFMAFSFTSDDLASALVERQRAGVEVAGVMEASQAESNIGSQYERFIAEGLDVRLDGNPRDMHHKVLVIDRRMVVMGSYNFTVYAERRNDENTLIVDDPGLAGYFLDEFERLFAQAQK